jgi:hypothetical protein
MACLMREAEHYTRKTKTGRTNYRWKYLRVGDYIPLASWDQYQSIYSAARYFAKKRPGWDFHMGTLENGRPALWRIA